jgi:hypothetical protein
MRKFHVPPSDETSARLRIAAREARHHMIAAFAAHAAGTSLDLDNAMESAGIEHMLAATALREVEQGLRAAVDID